MRPEYLLKLACLVMPWPAISQHSAFYPPDTRAAALGGAGITFTDVHSALSNQAGLAYLDQFSATAHAEQPFLVEELRSVALALAVPTSAGVFGAVIQYYGFQPYNEQQFGLSYARKLLQNLSIGAEFMLLRAAIAGYGQKTAYTFELGLISTLSRQIMLGLHVSNPLRIDWTEESQLPSLIRLGCRYQPSGKLALLGEVEKDIGYPVQTRWGIEYNPVELLQVRIGLATAPLSPRFGIGLYLLKSLRFDMAVVYHQLLGFTPCAGFTYQNMKP